LAKRTSNSTDSPCSGSTAPATSDWTYETGFASLNIHPIAVRLGSYRAEMIYWGMLGQKWWRNYLHTHSFYEICFAFEGRGVFRIAGEDKPIQAGDVFVAKPHEAHEIVSNRKEPLGIYFWAHTLVPTSYPERGPADQAIDLLLDQFISAQRWVCTVGEPGLSVLRLLSLEISQRSPGYTQMLTALTSKLLLDVARAVAAGTVSCEEPEHKPLSQAESVTQTVIRYLNDNLSRPIQIRDVAAQVHLSERHLSRLFQQITGSSLLDYLTTLRVEAASQLLLDRTRAIKNIAREVGYPDVHYFTTLFRRRTGQTPAVFRESGGTQFLRKIEPNRDLPPAVHSPDGHRGNSTAFRA
jgi:AraC-like DNA-binding protein